MLKPNPCFVDRFIRSKPWRGARLAICLTGGMVCAFACGVVRADEITDWNNIAQKAVLDTATDGVREARALAAMHLAQFDALNSITPRYVPYSRTGSFLPDAAGASPEAAADQAAYQVLANLYPTRLADFDAALSSRLGAIPDGPAKTAGINLGNAAASRILALRQNDHYGDVVPYTPGTNPGDWRPTGTAQRPAAFTQIPGVTPYAIPSPSAFRNPNGPPALTSAAFAASVNQVRDLGSINSTTRTADQSNIAKFWYLTGGTTVQVDGVWNQIAQTVLATHPHDLLDTARMFARLNMGQFDTLTGSFDNKYHYNLWRPETAIHMADTYNNPGIAVDKDWTPFLPAPAFPSYVSNHAALDGAAAEILSEFFEGDNNSFTVKSQGFAVPDRTFNSFSQAAEEGALSRIYAGIHYDFDATDGLALGHLVQQYIDGNELRPLPEPAVALPLIGFAGLILRRRRRNAR